MTAFQVLKDGMNVIANGGKDAMIWVDGEIREARSYAFEILRQVDHLESKENNNG